MDVDVDFYWPVLVIGSELNAVRYAVENKTHILFNRDPYIHSYQRTHTPAGHTLEQEWAQACYNLYDSGLHPFQNSINTIRIDSSNNLAKIFTKSEKKYTIRYDELKVFDLENVHGLEKDFHQELVHYLVLDWFDVKTTGGDMSLNLIEDKGSLFVNKVVFFDSTRIDGARQHKDILAESILTYDQLSDVNFTDTVARFKVVSMLEESGFIRPKIELWKRDIYPVKKTFPKTEGNISLMGEE